MVSERVHPLRILFARWRPTNKEIVRQIAAAPKPPGVPAHEALAAAPPLNPFGGISVREFAAGQARAIRYLQQCWPTVRLRDLDPEAYRRAIDTLARHLSA